MRAQDSGKHIQRIPVEPIGQQDRCPMMTDLARPATENLSFKNKNKYHVRVFHPFLVHEVFHKKNILAIPGISTKVYKFWQRVSDMF